MPRGHGRAASAARRAVGGTRGGVGRALPPSAAGDAARVARMDHQARCRRAPTVCAADGERHAVQADARRPHPLRPAVGDDRRRDGRVSGYPAHDAAEFRINEKRVSRIPPPTPHTSPQPAAAAAGALVRPSHRPARHASVRHHTGVPGIRGAPALAAAPTRSVHRRTRLAPRPPPAIHPGRTPGPALADRAPSPDTNRYPADSLPPKKPPRSRRTDLAARAPRVAAYAAADRPSPNGWPRRAVKQLTGGGGAIRKAPRFHGVSALSQRLRQTSCLGGLAAPIHPLQRQQNSAHRDAEVGVGILHGGGEIRAPAAAAAAAGIHMSQPNGAAAIPGVIVAAVRKRGHRLLLRAGTVRHLHGVETVTGKRVLQFDHRSVRHQLESDLHRGRHRGVGRGGARECCGGAESDGEDANKATDVKRSSPCGTREAHQHDLANKRREGRSFQVIQRRTHPLRGGTAAPPHGMDRARTSRETLRRTGVELTSAAACNRMRRQRPKD
eukprot:ctg_754.g456